MIRDAGTRPATYLADIGRFAQELSAVPMVSMRGYLRAGVIAGCLAACSAERRYLEPPALGDAKAMLVAIDGQGLQAVDLEQWQGAIELSTPSGEDRGLVELLLYAQPLAALDLAAGPVPAAAAEDTPERLPPAATRFELRLEEGDPWTESATLSPALASFRRASRPATCHRLRVASERLATHAGLGLVVPASSESALVASGGNVWLVDRDRTVLVTVDPPTPLRAEGAARDLDDDTLVLANWDGALYSGRLDPAGPTLSLTTLATASVPYPAALASGTIGGEREVFTLSVDTSQERSVFGRFVAGRWTMIRAFPSRNIAEEHGGLLRLGPGHALAGWAVAPEVVRWSNGSLSTEALESSQVGVASLAFIPGLGPIAGAGAGLIVRHDGERWTQLVATGVGFPITALAPFEDGFIFATAMTGALGYYTPAHGVCLGDVAVSNAPRAIVSLAPDTWLVAGDRRGGVTDPILARVTLERVP